MTTVRLGGIQVPINRIGFVRGIIISYVILLVWVLSNRQSLKFKKKNLSSERHFKVSVSITFRFPRFVHSIIARIGITFTLIICRFLTFFDELINFFFLTTFLLNNENMLPTELIHQISSHMISYSVFI